MSYAPEGRTMREAIEAGNCYELRWNDGASRYCPPAALTPGQVWEWAKELFTIKPGEAFVIYRILGGTIGCFMVEEVARFVAA